VVECRFFARLAIRETAEALAVSVATVKRDWALAVRRKLLGDEHPAVAQSLSSLGLLLRHRADYEAAERVYREALAMRRKLLGEEHPDLARTRSLLEQVLRERADREAAAAVP
jgi:hypothetical protein